MSATKAEERKALEQIVEIVKGLGTDSYIGTAFNGCFEIAEENIENDWAFSLKDTADRAEKKASEMAIKAAEAERKLEYARKEIDDLTERLDKELDWKDCDGGTNFSQEDYEELANDGASKKMSDWEARKLIEDEFGFDSGKVTIQKTVCTFEANRHHQMRAKETYDRVPVYESSDWNYIRFDCCGWFYEMINGELKQYIC